eukprot:289652-Chlamydomonas_euryale.AAC.1
MPSHLSSFQGRPTTQTRKQNTARCTNKKNSRAPPPTDPARLTTRHDPNDAGTTHQLPATTTTAGRDHPPKTSSRTIISRGVLRDSLLKHTDSSRPPKVLRSSLYTASSASRVSLNSMNPKPFGRLRRWGTMMGGGGGGHMVVVKGGGTVVRGGGTVVIGVGAWWLGVEAMRLGRRNGLCQRSGVHVAEVAGWWWLGVLCE